jgi:hypothetical protein
MRVPFKFKNYITNNLCILIINYINKKMTFSNVRLHELSETKSPAFSSSFISASCDLSPRNAGIEAEISALRHYLPNLSHSLIIWPSGSVCSITLVAEFGSWSNRIVDEKPQSSAPSHWLPE